MTAYYNEIDPYAAQWLRNLIDAGHIAPGYVDERSIEDVYPSDLKGFTQCHFFAGIGVWSLALRQAGWSDDRPVWTGSCPCQPFSAAGAGAGFSDARHLWPTFAWLIKQCKPPIIIGEQVASKAVEPWVDLVHADLEALGYAFGAVPFPSAGVGAPHIRDRLFWVANANGGDAGPERKQRSRQQRQQPKDGGGCELVWLGNTEGMRWEREYLRAGAGLPQDGATQAGVIDWLADNQGGGWREECQDAGGQPSGDRPQRWAAGSEHGGSDLPAGPVNGFWRNADWLGCRDDKWRPVEPGTFPLVNGASGRVGRLRAYGNAINAEAATAFIECMM